MNLLLASSGEKHTPLGHVQDKHHIDVGELLNVGIIGSVSMQMLTMILGAILLLLIMPMVAKRIATGPASEGNDRYVTKGRLSQIIEVMVLYLRDEMITPVMGEKQARKYFPFLMSLFFFILTMNLLGLVPLPDIQNIIGKFAFNDDHWAVIGGTPTSNINITVGLALISFIVIQFHSFRELGILGWLDHLTCGLTRGPIFLWLIVPVILVVEVASVFIKPAALAIRLFANMVGGHVLLATLLLFGSEFFYEVSTGGLAAIVAVSGIAAILITFMEVFVAFLQAFIFMFLTAVFISLMSHEEHEEHDAEHESHEMNEVESELVGQPAH